MKKIFTLFIFFTITLQAGSFVTAKSGLVMRKGTGTNCFLKYSGIGK